MKIITTADWHIGNMFHGIDRLPEHRHFMKWLLARIEEEKPDLLLVAGDVFDNSNPSAQAQTEYYDFLSQLAEVAPQMVTVVTSGNHDSGMRLQAPQKILRKSRIEIRGAVERWADDEDLHYDIDSLIVPVDCADGMQVAVIAVPYLRSNVVANFGAAGFIKLAAQRCREMYPDRRQIMMAHMYAKGAEIAARDASEKIVIGGEEEVSLGGWDEHPLFMVSGHIHKRQHIWGTDWARYPGSVLPMSFAEKNYKHGVDLVEITEDGKIAVKQLEYPLQHILVSLPADGEECDVKELKKQIKTLPLLPEGGMPDENAVYLELKVTMDNVSNTAIHELEEAVGERNAVLCKIQKLLPSVQVANAVTSTRYNSVDEIVNRDIMDVLRESYVLKHQCELSSRQEELLQSVLAKMESNLKETES